MTLCLNSILTQIHHTTCHVRCPNLIWQLYIGTKCSRHIRCYTVWCLCHIKTSNITVLVITISGHANMHMASVMTCWSMVMSMSCSVTIQYSQYISLQHSISYQTTLNNLSVSWHFEQLITFKISSLYMLGINNMLNIYKGYHSNFQSDHSETGIASECSMRLRQHEKRQSSSLFLLFI